MLSLSFRHPRVRMMPLARMREPKMQKQHCECCNEPKSSVSSMSNMQRRTQIFRTSTLTRVFERGSSLFKETLTHDTTVTSTGVDRW